MITTATARNLGKDAVAGSQTQAIHRFAPYIEEQKKRKSTPSQPDLAVAVVVLIGLKSLVTTVDNQYIDEVLHGVMGSLKKVAPSPLPALAKVKIFCQASQVSLT